MLVGTLSQRDISHYEMISEQNCIGYVIRCQLFCESFRTCKVFDINYVLCLVGVNQRNECLWANTRMVFAMIQRVCNPDLITNAFNVNAKRAFTKRNSLRLFLVFEAQLDDSELETRQLNASASLYLFS